MTIAEAFLKAIEVRQASPLLTRRIRRSLRKQVGDGDCSVALALPGRRREALYDWLRLGRRWADFRLGGCSWVGPADALRGVWRDQWHAQLGADHRVTDAPAYLGELAKGIGLSDRPLDRRGRDYLIGVLGTMPPGEGELCRLIGVRWFSSATVLVEAVNDLADHSVEERRSLRAHLASRLGGDEAALSCPTLQEVCAAVAETIGQPG